MRRLMGVVAIGVVLSPFIFVEGLYRYGLSLAGEPHLVSAGHMDRVHRVLWATFENGPMDEVVPLWPWRVMRWFDRPSTAGRRIAGQVARTRMSDWRGRTLERHFAEAAVIVWLTRNATGEELTKAAADSSYFGHGAHGVEQGAQLWFGKQAAALSWAESATLVSVSWSSEFDPVCRPERALTRRHFVLSRLLERSLITQQEFDQADSEALLPAGAPPCAPNRFDSPPDGDLEIIADE